MTTDREKLEAICELVEDDFTAGVYLKATVGRSKVSREEAKEIAIRLGRIYSIAHRIHCQSCESKPLKG